MTKLEAIEELELQCNGCLGKNEEDYCENHCEIRIAIDCIQRCIDEEDSPCYNCNDKHCENCIYSGRI